MGCCALYNNMHDMSFIFNNEMLTCQHRKRNSMMKKVQAVVFFNDCVCN